MSVDWPAIAAGTVIAAGVSFTLWAFGAAIGLSIVSTAPTWRDSTGLFWFLSGLFLLFNALCSFGIAGYAVGRMRPLIADLKGDESDYNDGVHGLSAWGLAILLTAALALSGAATVTKETTPSGGSAGAATSVAGENKIASELDELFRTDRTAGVPDLAYRRSEAARILLKSSSHHGVPQQDSAYLAAMVGSVTGTSTDEATDRVNRVISESADELHRTRMAAVLQAFLIAAALLVGAAVAWFAAIEGGRDRQLGVLPVWDWSWRGSRNRTAASPSPPYSRTT